MKSKQIQLAQIGEYGEDIYDFAKAGQWNRASTKLNLLKQAHSHLSASSSGSGLQTKLGQRIDALTQTIEFKDRLASMQVANRLTLSTARFTAKANAPVPLQVVLLDYYGRELEIGSLFANRTQVQASIASIDRTWKIVRSAVQDNDGTTQSRRFDNLVARLQKSRVPEGYGKLANLVLDQVDNLEQVFRLSLVEEGGEGNDRTFQAFR